MASIRIVTADHYMCAPIEGLDPVYSEFRGSTVSKVPVIRIFGTTKDGIKTCLHVHGVLPYLFIPFSGVGDASVLAYQLASSIDKALNIFQGDKNSNAQHIYKIVLVSGKPLYGYHKKEHQYFKIFFYNWGMRDKAVSLLQNGAICNKVFQPHEAHVPYILQFFIDYNLYGMSFIEFSSVKYRQAEESSDLLANLDENLILKSTPCTSFSQLEMDGKSVDILNYSVRTGTNLHNPGIAAIWEDERRRRNVSDKLEIAPPCSQIRLSSELQKTEMMYKAKLREKLQKLGFDKKESRLTPLSASYPAETPDNADLLSASFLEPVISLQTRTSGESTINEYLDDTIVDEQIVLNLSQWNVSESTENDVAFNTQDAALLETLETLAKNQELGISSQNACLDSSQSNFFSSQRRSNRNSQTYFKRTLTQMVDDDSILGTQLILDSVADNVNEDYEDLSHVFNCSTQEASPEVIRSDISSLEPTQLLSHNQLKNNESNTPCHQESSPEVSLLEPTQIMSQNQSFNFESDIPCHQESSPEVSQSEGGMLEPTQIMSQNQSVNYESIIPCHQESSPQVNQSEGNSLESTLIMSQNQSVDNESTSQSLLCSLDTEDVDLPVDKKKEKSRRRTTESEDSVVWEDSFWQNVSEDDIPQLDGALDPSEAQGSNSQNQKVVVKKQTTDPLKECNDAFNRYAFHPQDSYISNYNSACLPFNVSKVRNRRKKSEIRKRNSKKNILRISRSLFEFSPVSPVFDKIDFSLCDMEPSQSSMSGSQNDSEEESNLLETLDDPSTPIVQNETEEEKEEEEVSIVSSTVNSEDPSFVNHLCNGLGDSSENSIENEIIVELPDNYINILDPNGNGNDTSFSNIHDLENTFELSIPKTVNSNNLESSPNESSPQKEPDSLSVSSLSLYSLKDCFVDLSQDIVCHSNDPTSSAWVFDENSFATSEDGHCRRISSSPGCKSNVTSLDSSPLANRPLTEELVDISEVVISPKEDKCQPTGSITISADVHREGDKEVVPFSKDEAMRQLQMVKNIRCQYFKYLKTSSQEMARKEILLTKIIKAPLNISLKKRSQLRCKSNRKFQKCSVDASSAIGFNRHLQKDSTKDIQRKTYPSRGLDESSGRSTSAFGDGLVQSIPSINSPVRSEISLKSQAEASVNHCIPSSIMENVIKKSCSEDCVSDHRVPLKECFIVLHKLSDEEIRAASSLPNRKSQNLELSWRTDFQSIISAGDCMEQSKATSCSPSPNFQNLELLPRTDLLAITSDRDCSEKLITANNLPTCNSQNLDLPSRIDPLVISSNGDCIDQVLPLVISQECSKAVSNTEKSFLDQERAANVHSYSDSVPTIPDPTLTTQWNTHEKEVKSIENNIDSERHNIAKSKAALREVKQSLSSKKSCLTNNLSDYVEDSQGSIGSRDCINDITDSIFFNNTSDDGEQLHEDLFVLSGVNSRSIASFEVENCSDTILTRVSTPLREERQSNRESTGFCLCKAALHENRSDGTISRCEKCKGILLSPEYNKKTLRVVCEKLDLSQVNIPSDTTLSTFDQSASYSDVESCSTNVESAGSLFVPSENGSDSDEDDSDGPRTSYGRSHHVSPSKKTLIDPIRSISEQSNLSNDLNVGWQNDFEKFSVQSNCVSKKGRSRSKSRKKGRSNSLSTSPVSLSKTKMSDLSRTEVCSQPAPGVEPALELSQDSSDLPASLIESNNFKGRNLYKDSIRSFSIETDESLNRFSTSRRFSAVVALSKIQKKNTSPVQSEILNISVNNKIGEEVVCNEIKKTDISSYQNGQTNETAIISDLTEVTSLVALSQIQQRVSPHQKSCLTKETYSCNLRPSPKGESHLEPSVLCISPVNFSPSKAASGIRTSSKKTIACQTIVSHPCSFNSPIVGPLLCSDLSLPSKRTCSQTPLQKTGKPRSRFKTKSKNEAVLKISGELGLEPVKSPEEADLIIPRELHFESVKGPENCNCSQSSKKAAKNRKLTKGNILNNERTSVNNPSPISPHFDSTLSNSVESQSALVKAIADIPANRKSALLGKRRSELSLDLCDKENLHFSSLNGNSSDCGSEVVVKKSLVKLDRLEAINYEIASSTSSIGKKCFYSDNVSSEKIQAQCYDLEKLKRSLPYVELCPLSLDGHFDTSSDDSKNDDDGQHQGDSQKSVPRTPVKTFQFPDFSDFSAYSSPEKAASSPRKKIKSKVSGPFKCSVVLKQVASRSNVATTSTNICSGELEEVNCNNPLNSLSEKNRKINKRKRYSKVVTKKADAKKPLIDDKLCKLKPVVKLFKLDHERIKNGISASYAEYFLPVVGSQNLTSSEKSRPRRFGSFDRVSQNPKLNSSTNKTWCVHPTPDPIKVENKTNEGRELLKEQIAFQLPNCPSEV